MGTGGGAGRCRGLEIGLRRGGFRKPSISLLLTGKKNVSAVRPGVVRYWDVIPKSCLKEKQGGEG